MTAIAAQTRRNVKNRRSARAVTIVTIDTGFIRLLMRGCYIGSSKLGGVCLGGELVDKNEKCKGEKTNTDILVYPVFVTNGIRSAEKPVHNRVAKTRT
jgi:hypothetical protein